MSDDPTKQEILERVDRISEDAKTLATAINQISSQMNEIVNQNAKTAEMTMLTAQRLEQLILRFERRKCTE